MQYLFDNCDNISHIISCNSILSNITIISTKTLTDHASHSNDVRHVFKSDLFSVYIFY